MRWKSTVPVEWPGPAAIDGLWQQFDGARPVRLESEHGDRLEVTGEWGQPNSRYRFISPRLTRARLVGTVDRRRRLHVELEGRPLRRGPIAATLVADGIDGPRSLSTEGRIGPLAWKGSGSVANRRFRVAAHVPWLRVRFRIRQHHGQLETVLSIRGKGLATPLMAGLNAVFTGPEIQISLDEATADLAEDLGLVARGEFQLDPAPDDRAEDSERVQARQDLEAFDEYVRRVRSAVVRLQGRMDHRWWWGRRPEAWRREAEATLPHETGVDPLSVACQDLRSSVIVRLAPTPHKRRISHLTEIVEQDVPVLRAQFAERVFEEPPSSPPDYDQWLDLDWLHSIRSVIAHARKMDATPAAPV